MLLKKKLFSLLALILLSSLGIEYSPPAQFEFEDITVKSYESKLNEFHNFDYRGVYSTYGGINRQSHP